MPKSITNENKYQKNLNNQINNNSNYLNDIKLNKINEINSSKYLTDKEINQINEINKIKYFTNIKINQINERKIINEIKLNEINNIKKQIERIERIKSISNKINSDKMSRESYLDLILKLGNEIKNSILYDIFNNNSNLLSYEGIKNVTENSVEFIQYALSSYLSNNSTVCVIEKNTSCEEEAKTTLQLIANGDIFKKLINLVYDFGMEENLEILINEEKRKHLYRKEKRGIFKNI